MKAWREKTCKNDEKMPLKRKLLPATPRQATFLSLSGNKRLVDAVVLD